MLIDTIFVEINAPITGITRLQDTSYATKQEKLTSGISIRALWHLRIELDDFENTETRSATTRLLQIQNSERASTFFIFSHHSRVYNYTFRDVKM